MTTFVQRALVLGAAALLAGAGALALSDRGAGTPRRPVPKPALGPASRWYAASVGVAAPASARGRPTACGWAVRPGTLGVVHPVLPCGVKLYVAYGAVRALTEVVDRGPVPQGEAFELTPALARLLGLEGVHDVRWAFVAG